MELERFHEHASRLKDGLRRVFFGQDDVIEQLLATIYAGGHALLEGVPGLGKTLLAKGLARLFDADATQNLVTRKSQGVPPSTKQ